MLTVCQMQHHRTKGFMQNESLFQFAQERAGQTLNEALTCQSGHVAGGNAGHVHRLLVHTPGTK